MIDLALILMAKSKKFLLMDRKNNKICYATALMIHENNVISKIEEAGLLKK